MKESLQIAKQQLIERWITAFDEIDEYKKYEQEVSSVKYSREVNYNLDDLKNGKLNPKKRFLKTKPGNTTYYEYGLNKKGLPVISLSVELNEHVGWVGFYKWSNDFVEYIEFCLFTKVPSCIQRVFLKNNNKLIYQSLDLYTRSHYLVFLELSKNEIIEHVVNNHSFTLNINKYKYRNNAITKSCGIHNFLGQAEYNFEDIYFYDKRKVLQKIKRFYENWPPQIQYIKPSLKTFKKLSYELSQLLAKYIIEALSKFQLDSPLFNVQIEFHYCDNYWPEYLRVITEQSKIKALNGNEGSFFINHTFFEWIRISESKIEVNEETENMFAQFIQRITDNENWEAGRKMLRQVARIMNENKLCLKVPVSKEFVAFALDPTLIEDVEECLIKSGADKQKVKEWKKLKWF